MHGLLKVACTIPAQLKGLRVCLIQILPIMVLHAYRTRTLSTMGLLECQILTWLKPLPAGLNLDTLTMPTPPLPRGRRLRQPPSQLPLSHQSQLSVRI